MGYRNTKKMLKMSVEIIALYRKKGLKLTLRQLYYQLVSKNIIPNTSNDYHSLGRLLTKARRDGVLGLDVLEDRSRVYHSQQGWDSAKDALMALKEQFRLSGHNFLEWNVLVLVEKDALIGVIQPVCDMFRVDYMGTKGYLSVSKEAVIYKNLKEGSIILYLGDHDPSGLDVFETLKVNLGSQFKIKRIGLSIEQIKKYKLPPQPAKKTDKRYKSYSSLYGNKSWELDALKPEVLQDLLNKKITENMDHKGLSDLFRVEEKERANLTI